MKKNNNFEIIVESINTPDAEERIIRALSILVSEEDIISHQNNSNITKVRYPDL